MIEIYWATTTPHGRFEDTDYALGYKNNVSSVISEPWKHVNHAAWHSCFNHNVEHGWTMSVVFKYADRIGRGQLPLSIQPFPSYILSGVLSEPDWKTTT